MFHGPQRHCQPTDSLKKLVILLHGYGANGDNLIDLADIWAKKLPHVGFYAPNAPEVCDAIPYGRQWFGIRDFNPYDMRAGLDKAAPLLKAHLEEVLTGLHLNASDLILVGFSQGSMMALEMMFHLPKIKGIIAYSGVFYPPVSPSPLLFPPDVLLIHGNADMVVPYPLMAQSVNQLSPLGVTPQTHTCVGLGHSIDLEGISLGGAFLSHVFFPPHPI